MKYELALFERIINGDLSPFHDDAVITPSYHQYLEEKHSSSYLFLVAKFKQSKAGVSMMEKNVTCSLHPGYEWHIVHQQHLFVTGTQTLEPNILDAINIEVDAIVSASIQKRLNLTSIYLKLRHQHTALPTAEAKYYYYNSILKSEVARVKQSIKDAVFMLTTPDQIEEFIHKQQQAIITLSVKLMWMISQAKHHDIYRITTEFKEIDVLSLVYIRLEELLIFIERHYPKYLDGNVKIPFRSALLQMNNSLQKIETVNTVFSGTDIDPALIQIVKAPFSKLNLITLQSRITYRELIYANYYLDTLHDAILSNNNNITEPILRSLLYQLNYNALEFFNYEIENIKNNLSQMEVLGTQINHLLLCLKLNNQKICRANVYYDPSLPAIKAQLTTWLEEELNYLTRTSSLTDNTPNPNNNLQKTKLPSSLTVAQLSLFFKVQNAVGLLPTKEPADIFNHIVTNYKTNNASDISFDSIRNKFYNLEQSSVDVVKGRLIEMLNYLNAIDLYK
jgi:hypothetical protein